MPTAAVTITTRLPEELVAAIDRIIPRGGRNAWIQMACEHELERDEDNPFNLALDGTRAER